MLNRRILRIKAFEALYSSVILNEGGARLTIEEAADGLRESCEAVRDLYVFMLGLVPALTGVEKARKNSDPKFCSNRLSALLESDADFLKIWKKKAYSWDQYDIILKKIASDVTASPYYASYISSGKSSIEEDCRLFVSIYENAILDAEGIDGILESMSIHWNDDLGYALTMCCKTFKKLASQPRWSLPPLYQSDMLAMEGKKLDSDSAFVRKLFQNAYSSYDSYSALISESVPSFDKDRLVMTDVCLMVCCMAEAVNFPEIPVRVSINEYVEISKFFGTPKSSVFVNGILDRLINRFIEEGKIVKN